MKKWSFAVLMLMLAQPVCADGWGSIFRSITSSIGGGGDKTSTAGSATIGSRGMDENAATASTPTPEDVKMLDGWAATESEAKTAAGKRGLVANTQANYPSTAAAPAPASSGETP